MLNSRKKIGTYWEIIADNLKKRGWSLGWVSAVDSRGRTIWIVDGHRDDGKRFVARADDKLTAFLELESAIRGAAMGLTFNSRYVRLNSHARGTPSRHPGATEYGDT
ncbi:MAG: hypothetical protein E6J48_08140 [Chloroflexi bacterium]|nr:MAG: hypothetical protein E6J48_08140 [Chloroflexota bacterium]